MTIKYPHSRQVRLDPATLDALDQVARFTFQSKCGLIRSYVAKCVQDDLIKYQQQVASVRSMTNQLAAV